MPHTIAAFPLIKYSLHSYSFEAWSQRLDVNTPTESIKNPSRTLCGFNFFSLEHLFDFMILIFPRFLSLSDLSLCVCV